MNALVLGGSRNIGYESSLRILAKGGTVTFLLRRANTFEKDPVIQKYIADGNVNICVGDALIEADVSRAWDVAGSGGRLVNLVLFSIGGIPRFNLRRGFYTEPRNLVALSMLNLLTTWPKSMTPQPQLIAITSNGLTKRSHAALPFLLRLMYRYTLDEPHRDKLGVERLLFKAIGWDWTEAEPSEDILPSGWSTHIDDNKWLKNVVVVRPALLTDGACLGDSKSAAYRTGPEDLKSAWTVSRKDTAHFIVTQVLTDFGAFTGKCITIAY